MKTRSVVTAVLAFVACLAFGLPMLAALVVTIFAALVGA